MIFSYHGTLCLFLFLLGLCRRACHAAVGAPVHHAANQHEDDEDDHDHDEDGIHFVELGGERPVEDSLEGVWIGAPMWAGFLSWRGFALTQLESACLPLLLLDLCHVLIVHGFSQSLLLFWHLVLLILVVAYLGFLLLEICK